ncbi:MAG: hypothetical protein IKA17_10320 [Clostridia bacterium]|nr:hypothetical protein [Clostridia bacterium]
MYQINEKFVSFDDNLLPYTLKPELHTTIRDFHAATDERGFVMKSIGNRWIIETPEIENFDFNITFAYTFLKEFNPRIHIFFGYNKKSRTGQGLQLIYHLNGGMTVNYITVDRMNIKVLETIEFSEIKLEEEENIEVKLSLKDTKLTGFIGEKQFSFTVESVKGHIALERKNFIGEWIIRSFSVSTDDELISETILEEKTVEIPMREGGDIPYEFTYGVEKTGEQYYLNVKLGGGTATRKLNREDRPGQYVAEKDTFTTPFVILRNNQKTKKFNIFKGERKICDPNIFWECLKDYFNHPEMPICIKYPISEYDFSEEATISFGYEFLSCTGYNAQAGGPSEFIYNAEGELLYGGDALCESMFELYSPEDKYATTLIPEDTYEREAVLHHLAVNHYFHIDENINFKLALRTKLKKELFSINAEIRNIYDSETLEVLNCEISGSSWKFGYSEICAKVTSKPLPLGVYRIVYMVYYGGMLYKEYNKVFEVFDKDSNVSPAIASGLPYVFSMPNEQKWLMSNTFDLWNPKPSCDEIHFISCVTNTPIEAEKQKIWEIIHIFGREWFAWLNRRTCIDYSLEGRIETVKHADYLNHPIDFEVFPLRNDLHLVKTYQSPEVRALLHEFLRENPQFAEKILYQPPTEEGEFVPEKPIDASGIIPEYTAFTYEQLKNLLDVCSDEWIDFADRKLLELFKKQNEKIKKINPEHKRAAYGPFNAYVNATLSYHTIKAYGFVPYKELAEDIYTGFAVFEDYPASCAYQTYRGAFAVMTIMLHCPSLVLYPEQYSGSSGGCIDGAVKFSHAPMGKYEMPLYYNSTHAFEFVFNTPYKTNDGYRYWTSYGFHRADHSPDMADRLVKDWKAVAKCKPARPLRTMAMITEYFNAEDVFDGDIISLHGHTTMYNVSEEGHGYIYECAREAGLNAPFALKFETLKELSKDECDVLVIPSLKYADEDSVAEIRRLYNEGVSLVAVSDVCGLEDIFGVREERKKLWIESLHTDDDDELIYPNEANFKYASDGAEILICAENGTPVVLKNKNALLINASVSTLGHECFEGAEGKTRRNVSELLRDVLKRELVNASEPLAIGQNTGITLFESENGNTHLLCIDYSEYDNRNIREREAVVKLDLPVAEISSERDFGAVRNKDGLIEEIRFKIYPHEAVMFTLEQ